MKTLGSLLLCACVCAGEIRVTGGAADDQVFQRGASQGTSMGSASIPLTGSSSGKNGDTVEARLVRKHVVVPGFDWTVIARVSAGAWSGELKIVPAGGPYRVEIRSAGSNAAVNNLLVGDLWVLAGQSNMQGVGDLVDLEMPHELVHNFDMADRWVVAEEPLHSLQTAIDPVHWGKGQTAPLAGEALQRSIANRRKGAGLGLPFAVEMVKRTSVPVGLLSCAHGGTSMDQWDPALKSKAGESLYGSMYRRVKAAGGRVTGVLWYQGESDASPKAAPAFLQKFERLVSSIREDFGLPELPFYYVQIGRHISDANVADWNLVQDMQRRAEKTISHSGMVTAVDLSLDDGIHVSTPDHKRLGKRFANLVTNPSRPGPRPVSAKFDNGVVHVAFSGVNGRLQSPGRLSGFSIHSPEGASLSIIYKMRVDPADPNAVLLHVGGKIPSGATLRYGNGKDPYCNVRDSADMALPAFQGVAIE